MTNKLGKIWNSPNTAVGHIVRLFFNRKDFSHKRDGHYVSRRGSRLDLMMHRVKVRAITLGEIVLYRSDAFIGEVIQHEMVHISQGRRWGPLFFLAYGAASLFNLVRRGRLYDKNQHFEKAAIGRNGSKKANR